MAIIKPISDLRNKSKQISKLVHESREPVFITKNGEGDMVLMSMQEYRKMVRETDLLSKLLEAESDLKNGIKPLPAREALKKIREKHFGRKKI